ncbi:VOC family protein [Priestia megaterium]|uniref:VOC family protein n=1 Tax=Priestia megaterium TaxID=1404 RepID=UPI0026E27387|nr:VOC family protein [Priestia megaterium]MDO6847619.1 VOC family protein [Priestia megaterium]
MNFHRAPYVFVGKVNLKVENLERSLAFYQQIIGFKLLGRKENKALLTADGRTALLSIEQPENVTAKQPRTTGLYHFALLLPTRSDLGSILQHLLNSGYPLQGASDHLVSEALYLADPDGNGIEIYRDRPSSTWEWNEGEVAMATKPLDAEAILAEGNGKPWTGLPSATLMGHIHLHVSELGQTENFYRNGLGFEVVSNYHNQALFISTGRYHHHIGLNVWNGIGAPSPLESSVGLESFTLVFPAEEAREQAINKLREIGAAVSKENQDFITKDPSGNIIRLVL